MLDALSSAKVDALIIAATSDGGVRAMSEFESNIAIPDVFEEKEDGRERGVRACMTSWMSVRGFWVRIMDVETIDLRVEAKVRDSVAAAPGNVVYASTRSGQERTWLKTRASVNTITNEKMLHSPETPLRGLTVTSNDALFACSAAMRTSIGPETDAKA